MFFFLPNGAPLPKPILSLMTRSLVLLHVGSLSRVDARHDALGHTAISEYYITARTLC